MAYPYYQNFGYQQPQMDGLQQLRNQSMYQHQQQDERIWVQGEGAAQAYLVAPNAFVRLWDSSKNVFYEKRADQSGRPYMEAYEYKRMGSQAPSVSAFRSEAEQEYTEKINGLERRIEALERGIKNAKSDTDDSGIQSVPAEL